MLFEIANGTSECLPENSAQCAFFGWVLLTDHLSLVNVFTDQSLNSCKPGHVAATRNPFAPLPLFNPNALFSSSAETVCLQSSFAGRVLRRIAAALGVSHWDFTAGPCDYGGSGVHCDCSFSNGTVCHVTEMYASLLTYSHFFRQQNGVRGFEAMTIYADPSRSRTSPASSRLTSPTSPTFSSCEFSTSCQIHLHQKLRLLRTMVA